MRVIKGDTRSFDPGSYDDEVPFEKHEFCVSHLPTEAEKVDPTQTKTPSLDERRKSTEARPHIAA